ncbi:MAG: VTT domain-containing protein [bacterium]
MSSHARDEPGPGPESHSADRADRDRLLVEGQTCWRIERAHRMACLIDGEAYFEAVADAMAGARRQILMLGWDFHSRVRLRRTREDDGLPDELAARLDALVERNPRLHVHVLGWDFAMIYAFERESLPLFRLGLRTRPRVHFRLDDHHPVGASHHQKIVVIDDAIAFVGGFDLTSCRWDTRAHRARDERRSDPGFPECAPFHDVQMAVDAEAARALGELARQRWWRATGKRLQPPDVAGDPWPAGLEPDCVDVEVGIARTQPDDRGQEEVREIERLHLESIRSARQTLYIENQYLTAARLGEALAERLREPEGPEILIVAPRYCSGWLEEGTMGTLRARLLDRLREADRFGRLRVFHPVVPELEGSAVNVHAKVMIVDDRLLRVGSANLSNRSMGLDTECDLAIEAQDERVRATIARLRHDLLAEHLGVSVERVAEAVSDRGSLIEAVESLRGGPRTLQEIETELPDWLEDVVPEASLFDPERPVGIDRMRTFFMPEDVPDEDRSLLWRFATSLLVIALLAAAWRWTPLSEWTSPERLAAWGRWFQEDPMGPLVAIGSIAIAGCLMVPITVLIVATGLVFGWLKGFSTALAGALLGTALGYALGRVLWRDVVRRLGGKRLNRLSSLLASRGVLSVATVRLIPIAPFTIVNLVAGSSHVRLRDTLLGTLIGMAPGTLILTAFSDNARSALLDPGWSTLLSVLVIGVVGFWAIRRLRRALEAREREREETQGG